MLSKRGFWSSYSSSVTPALHLTSLSSRAVGSIWLDKTIRCQKYVVPEMFMGLTDTWRPGTSGLHKRLEEALDNGHRDMERERWRSRLSINAEINSRGDSYTNQQPPALPFLPNSTPTHIV